MRHSAIVQCTIALGVAFLPVEPSLASSCRLCDLLARFKQRQLSARLSTTSRVSAECLICHDGTLASIIPGVSALPHMPGDHPVSVFYDPVHNERAALHDSHEPSGLGRSIDEDLLVDGRVECVSCHTRHDKGKQPSPMRITMEGSRLCLTCHNK